MTLDPPADNIVLDVLAELRQCDPIVGLHALPSQDFNPVLTDTMPNDPLFDISGLCCPHPVDKCKDWSNPQDSVAWTHTSWALQDWNGNGLNCPEAWGYDSISNNIRVAVLDQGIWWPNPEFGGDSTVYWGGDNVVQTGQDWVDTTGMGTGIACEEREGDECWDNGHGTAMAGLIAARTNDERGMAGVCWGNAELGAMRVIHGCGPPDCPSYWGEGWEEVFTVLGGASHACHVASGSIMHRCIGCPSGGSTWFTVYTTLRAASRKAFVQDSVAMFFAAGNEDNDMHNPPDCSSRSIVYPAALPWIESITATHTDGSHMANYWHGNCGCDSWTYPYGWIDLAAPAGPNWPPSNIPAPQFERCSRFWPRCKHGSNHPDSLIYRMGRSCCTSAATALSAGVGAMVIDAYIDSGAWPGGPGSRPIPEDVYGIMEWSSKPCWKDDNIPAPWNPNYHVGWGRVDAGLAVYDALYADIDHRATAWEDKVQLIGSYEWDCPAGDLCDFPSKKVVANAYRFTREVWLPPGARAGCWGHHRAPTNGAAPLLMINGLQAADVVDALDYKWCDLTEYDRFADVCTLETFIYFLFHQAEPGRRDTCRYEDPYENAYVPCLPGEVTFSYTTFSSDRFLSNVDDGNAKSYGNHLPKPALEAFPQPFNPVVSIRYSIPTAGRVTMRIYDVRGRTVRTLVAGEMNPGLYFTRWEGKDDDGLPAASGVYFCRLEVSGQATVEKVVLLR